MVVPQYVQHAVHDETGDLLSNANATCGFVTGFTSSKSDRSQ